MPEFELRWYRFRHMPERLQYRFKMILGPSFSSEATNVHMAWRWSDWIDVPYVTEGQ